MTLNKQMMLAVSALCVLGCASLARESLTPLKDERAPQTHAELWASYDPRAEPLDVEILKEWEEDGVVLKVLRYRIGIFKGQNTMMAAVYGYPKGGQDLPGLVQIHGGGQYADYRAPLTNGKRGYATISIAWAGRINAPGYRVTPTEVKLFWEGKTDDPDYKLTTDWGLLDAYHAPCRNSKNSFARVAPAPWTLDAVESPRNNPWFLCALGARRALTFLERQPEVDADKLGVYGHSMGGKLTVLTTAADSRVKASAPSCGGISDRHSNNALYSATINDNVNLKRIACPIIFLSPSNDFHGRINHLPAAVREIKSTVWRVTSSPHHNHQDTPEYEVATQLWFDQHLKGAFTFPRTPKTELELDTPDGVPLFTVEPDTSQPILHVEIYYTQQGQEEGEIRNRENRINRFWHHTRARKNGKTWTADLPLLSTDLPLWVYANVVYPLDKPVSGAGYYYSSFTAETFNLSSLMRMVTADQLKAVGTRATLKRSLVIESFEGDWEKEWFTYRPQDWARRTHKIYDEQWKAPEHAKLALEVRSAQPNKLVVGIDQYAAEIQLNGGSAWQRIALSSQDFRNIAGGTLSDWEGIKELRLGSQETLRAKRGQSAKPLTLGAAWQGARPEFRSLRWIAGPKECYPSFSWETVPIAFHFGKSASLMTDEEAQFVASHASFICLEK
ncbi:MAG: dienelactone hydrolase family protein, partial [Planctomycetota bacterium]